ncbi:hypothetical protein R1sor_008405 [Riccia sorocarpa]|uniref:Glycosyltransferase n=1 Tax=Riccia sorocarpa TaxID=122646 RepID=A0ABD3HWR3_9MARC
MAVSSVRGPARALLVPIQAEGHFKPFLQLMRRLAKSRISFTVLCNQERCDELSRFKADGQFDDLDVDFMPLFRDFSKLTPPSPFPHMLDDWRHRSMEIDPSRFACMITDMFTYFLHDDAVKWGIPKYTFISSGCYTGLYLIQGDKIVEEGWLFSNPDKRHQSVTLPGLELFTPLQLPRTNLQLEQNLPKLAVSLRKSDGLLFNSFEAFDKEPLEIMSRQPEITQFPGKANPKLFAIGPLVSLPLSYENLHELTSKPGDSSREIIDWLDGQRKSSVLFISLGSARPLPKTGAIAFAEALEQTGVPFFWVLRLPPGHSVEEYLPPGFEAKTKEQGIVWTHWVPQEQLLRHPSIGGFLSHCGWNSLMEAISAGVPIAACPMYAEQGLNAKHIVDVLQIAVEIKYKEDYFDFDSETVAVAINTIMDEHKVAKIRENVLNMQRAIFEAVAEGGTSYRSFEEFISTILNHRTVT